MFTIQTDMMQTVAIAIIVLFVGKYLRGKVAFFERFCIPAPVIGGFLFAIIHLLLKVGNIATFEMDETLKNPFMMVFFTTIGLGANLETLKKGGKGFIIFTLISTALVVFQNTIGMGLSKLLGQNSLLGLACGSITMVGGHGTAGAWGPTLEEMGLQSGEVIALAAATFGVIMGSLIGGPVGSALIRRYNLTPDESSLQHFDEAGNIEVAPKDELTAYDFLKVLGVVFVSIGLGVILKKFLADHVSIAGTPLNLPEYVAAMIFAAIYINTLGRGKTFGVDLRANSIVGDVGLNVFLVIALISLDLMQLKAVAGPMLIVLFAQTVFMIIFTYLVTFTIMGKNYDAAVLAGGMCGFGMGATYNALANMDSITEKYGPAPKAYFILPMVGAFAIDIINVLIITGFAQIKF
ncbi:sodium/glutamate symporter [Peptoniphilus equinus]|uniref:Sodium/glutamate symporter n=1 Tax=Peptoniphilus equinus TaxID=3016343 RepID=A0ABY7QTD8_9FIRM|nr:sodium/glutamate symporter [Peptoniphilus equinus]WBW50061.1 sodium/glutamate symporter [Peptoniphilus equinus]